MKKTRREAERSKERRMVHLGGAWKVAYADFVTAMMALFMVLWISAQDDEILISTSQYFQTPFNSPLDQSVGILDGAGSGQAQRDMFESRPSTAVDMAFLNALASEFYRLLNIEHFSEDQPIDVTVTSEGLKITVFNNLDRPVFEGAGSEFTEWGNLVMQNLAWMIDRHDLKVRVDAHAATPAVGSTEVNDLWVQTSDQAHQVREALTFYALDPEKMEQVTAYADTKPHPDYDPQDPRNQRIEISLKVTE